MKSALRILSMVIAVLFLTSVAGPLVVYARENEVRPSAAEWIKAQVPKIEKIGIELEEGPALWDETALDIETTEIIRGPQRLGTVQTIGTFALFSLVMYTTEGFLAKYILHIPGSLWILPATIVNVFIYAAYADKFASLSFTNTNYPDAAKRAIEIGTQNILFLYEYYHLTEKNTHQAAALSELRKAIGAYYKGDPGGTALLVLPNFGEVQFQAVKEHIVNVINHNRLAIDVVSALGPVEMPPSRGITEIVVGVDYGRVGENIYDTIDSEFAVLRVEENWPYDLKRTFATAMDAITFVESLGINAKAMKVSMVEANDYAKKGLYAEASAKAMGVRAYAYGRAVSLVSNRLWALQQSGAAADTVSKLNLDLADAKDVLLPAGDYPAFKEKIRGIISTYVLEFNRLALASRVNLEYMQTVYNNVVSLVDYAEREGLMVAHYRDALLTISGDLTDAGSKIDAGKIADAKAILSTTVLRLRTLEDQVRGALRVKLAGKISITQDTISATRNIGGLVYFRRTFLLKNDAPVPVYNIHKVLGVLPRGFTTASTRVFKNAQMDMDVYITENLEIVAKISSAAPNTTAEVSVWYWAPALSISTSWRIKESFMNNIVMEYTINVRNTSYVDIENLPLEIETPIQATAAVTSVVVLSGAAAGAGRFDGGKLIITSTLEQQASRTIVVDLTVVAAEVVVELVEENAIVVGGMPLTVAVTAENAEMLYNEYIRKFGRATIRNTIGFTISNVKVSIPLVANTREITIMTPAGELIGSVEVPPGVPVTSIGYTIPSLPTAGLEYIIIYKVLNERVWLYKDIRTLGENIKYANTRRNIAVSYGLTVTAQIDSYISVAETALGNAKTYYEQGAYTRARAYIAQGNTNITLAISELDARIHEHLTAENKARVAIAEAENTVDTLSIIIGGLYGVVPPADLDEYRLKYNEFNWRIADANEALAQNRFADAERIGKDIRDNALKVITSLRAYADKVIESDVLSARAVIDELGYLIARGEQYGVDLAAVKKHYRDPANRYYEEALISKYNGVYSAAKLNLSQAKTTAKDGIGRATASINVAGSQALSTIKGKDSALMARITLAESKVESYNTAIGATEDRTMYQYWSKTVVNIKVAATLRHDDIRILEQTAISLNNYITVLIKENVLITALNADILAVDNIISETARIIDQRKEQAKGMLALFEQTLLDINKGAIELEARAGAEKAAPYKDAYKTLDAHLKNARQLYADGKYTLVKELSEAYYVSALDVKTNLMSEIGAYPAALPINAVTSVLTIILFGLIAALFIVKSRKRENRLTGTVRNPEGTYLEGTFGGM